MKKIILIRIMSLILANAGVTFLSGPTIAQVMPDQTLPTPSIVTPNNSRSTITGGTESGSYLFHSFSQFSIPINSSAYFNNSSQIQTIITRVTGNTSSNINGLIQANGTANLFLLNPNGIFFGPNAKLDLGGSFTASTADRIIFSDGQTFSATDPKAPPLLTVNLPIGIQLGQPMANSTIESQAILSVPQNLTLQADQLNLSGELKAGQDLTLRSPNPVIGSGSFSSGGNFRVEQLDGALGQLLSPSSVMIRSLGDVSFDSYQGASLHIFAAGSVIIPNDIQIDRADPVNGIVENVRLSDGTSVAINGQKEATLDIRAGMNPAAIAATGSTAIAPTRADIQLGGISFTEVGGTARIGRVLLTNQFEPNLSLAGGDITLARISAVAFRADGPQTAIDARGGVSIANALLGFSNRGNGGDTKILAQGNVDIPYINNASNTFNGGNIAIVAGGTLNLPGGASTSTLVDNAGTVQLTAKGNITTGSIDAISTYGNAGSVQISSINGAIDANAGIFAYADFRGRNGGTVTFNAARDIQANSISTSGGILGKGGDIAIASRGGNISVEGSLFSATFGVGDAGAITLKAGRDIVLKRSDLISSVILGTGGNAQDITLEAGRSIFLNQTALVSSAGIDATAVSDRSALRSLTFPKSPYYPSQGNAGTIRLKAGQDIIGTDSALYSTAIDKSQGNAGNIELSAGNQITWQQERLRFLSPGLYAYNRGQGNAGDIAITAKSFSLLGAGVETGISFNGNNTSGISSDGIGESGNIKINVQDQVLLDKGTPDWFSVITAQIRPAGQSAEAIGAKGNIQIQAGSLILRNRSEISTGVGDIDRGSIAGGTAKGNAGNIELNIKGALSLNQSSISSRIFANGEGNAGTIDIQAGTIAANQSVITSDTAGQGNANRIRLRADQTIQLNDSDISSAVQPGGRGQGQDITLTAPSVELSNGAQINTLTSGAGAAGNVLVNADVVRINGTNQVRSPKTILYLDPQYTGINDFYSSTAPDFVDGVASGIFSSTNTASRGGNITVNARSLNVSSGGQVDARTTNAGIGGTINITSGQVQLLDGGQISAIASGSGKGGIIALNSNQIQISGSDATYSDRLAQFGTTLDLYGKANVSNQGPNSGLFASTEAGSTGAGGSISIVTRDLLLTQSGVISVNSQGRGNGGTIEVTSDRLLLDRGNLVAKTASGEGGDIFLKVQDLLTLRNNSQISATANGIGNGGNIEISSPNGFIIAVPSENSDITANANKGRGGNINITAQSIFGIVPRSTLTNFSDITASSDLGINGTVNVNALASEPKSNASVLPTLIDTSDQIAQTCSTKNRSNTFVVTGKGGLPPDPNEALNATQPWQSNGLRRTINANTKSVVKPVISPKKPIESLPLLEATHWIKDADGRMSLVAAVPVRSITLNCAGKL